MLASISHPPARKREFASIAIMVVLVDYLLYQGHGYAGIAAFLLLAPIILLPAILRAQLKLGLWCVAPVLLLFAMRLSWHGTPLRVVCAMIAVVSAAQTGSLTLRGIAWFPVQVVPAGVAALIRYVSSLRISGRIGSTKVWLRVGLPVIALLVFGTLFVLANPDAVTYANTTPDMHMKGPSG